MNHSDEIRPAIETARLILRTVTMEKIGMKYVGLDEEGGYAFTINKDEYQKREQISR